MEREHQSRKYLAPCSLKVFLYKYVRSAKKWDQSLERKNLWKVFFRNSGAKIP